MFKWGTLTWIMLLLLVCAPVMAQTPEPDVWPPDPQTLFMPGVEWSIQPELDEEEIQQEAPPKRAVENNYANAMIQYTDPVTGIVHLYPYAEGFDANAVQNLAMLDDHTVQVIVRPVPLETQIRIYHLDLDTGMYEQATTPLVCEDRVIKDETGEGEWRLVPRMTNIDEPEAFLCHTKTGEQHTFDAPDFVLGGSKLIPTPDENRLLIVGFDFSDFPVFVYDLSQETLIPLGTVNRNLDNTVSVCDWMTETIALLCTEDGYGRNYIPEGYYSLDITQRDSLEYVFSGWPDTISRLENPKRYVSFFTSQYFSHRVGSYMGDGCFLTIYDATGVRSQGLGALCNVMLYSDYSITFTYPYEDGFYYLASNGKTAKESALYYYNETTETISGALFTGEIESIISTSPDGRYAVLVMDDNGFVGLDWHEGMCCSHATQMGILDRQTGQLIYRSEPMGIYKWTQVDWLDETTLLVSVAETYKDWAAEGGDSMVPGSVRRIVLEGGSITETLTKEHTCEFSSWGAPLDLWDTLSPDGEHCFTGDGFVVDTTTFEAVPVFHELSGYYTIGWVDNKTLSLHLNSYGDAQPSSITYHVKLP